MAQRLPRRKITLWLWGIFGGTLCFITGLAVGLHFHLPLPVWIAGVTAGATWGPLLGPMMWRASSMRQ